MKACRTLILLLILLGPSLSKAQNFVGFPDSNAIWTNSYSSLNTSTMPFSYDLVYAVKYCLTNADTLIVGNQYSQLFICDSAQHYVGAIRHDSDRVFLVPADSSREFLMYDFGLQIGDSLKPFYHARDFWNPNPRPFADLRQHYSNHTVNHIDTVYSSWGAHRVIDFGTASKWVEGVGNMQGLFWEPYGNISGYALSLECMSWGDSTYYMNGYYSPPINVFPGACDLSFSVPEQGHGDLRLYPNPSAGALFIEGQTTLEPGPLKVFDLNGRELKQIWIEEQRSVDLSELPKGVYMIHFQSTVFPWVKN